MARLRAGAAAHHAGNYVNPCVDGFGLFPSTATRRREMAASTRAAQRLARCAPSAIWWRQLAPSATIQGVAGRAHCLGSESSAICIDTAWLGP